MNPPLQFPTPPTQKIRRKAAKARTLAYLRHIILDMCGEIERAGVERRSCACCWRNQIRDCG